MRTSSTVPLPALLVLTALASSARAPAAQSARVVLGSPGNAPGAGALEPRSFHVRNTSAGERIAFLRIDLSTAVLPGLAFDPAGAGELAAPGFAAGAGGGAVGLAGHGFEGSRDGGFEALWVRFDDFDPGESFSFSFSVEVGPSLGGAVPRRPAAVRGLDLTGAGVRVAFDGGTVLESRAFPAPGSEGAAECALDPFPPPAPALSIDGYEPPARVYLPSVTARVTGTPGAPVRLLALECAALVAPGAPGLGPFGANAVVRATELAATLDERGSARIEVPIARSAEHAGIFAVVASEVGPSGLLGPSSPPVALQAVDAAISFAKFKLQNLAVQLPTSLAWGPDGRLYLAEQTGTIRGLSIVRGPDGYSVTANEPILAVREIPNHQDDGTPAPEVFGRQVTGILVTGTASEPVIWVASSDPRIGGELIGETGLDTNSGILSKVVRQGGAWVRRDLVRGLPRSEENHGPNGLVLDEASQVLFLAQGGNTNMGAPSAFFAGTPEYALSGAILAIDLAAIGEGTYDLPTLDDEDRPGDPDANDPFGGNDGKNQARLVPGGPVRIHSPGWRNPYDLVVTQAGRMYAVDNGPNGGWGGTPAILGGTCTNDVVEPGTFDPDGLHFISGHGYYAGHPNPTRASTLNTFNETNPQSPVSTSNPIECQYLTPGVEDGALVTWPASTNGIAEYTASAFEGALAGDLLLIGLDQELKRVKLDAEGDDVLIADTLFTAVGNGSLDVTTLGDAAPFPGTIWVANRNGNGVTIFEPVPDVQCTGVDSYALDEDRDGYSNGDEIDNGTDPCSAGDVPADHDQDLLSDLNDPDDDGDLLPDTLDRFALDAKNGLATAPPFTLGWETDEAAGAGLLNTGFTGLMQNGAPYASLFDPETLTAGGAAGVLTLEEPGPGTAFGGANTLEAGFQIGFRPPAAPFTVRTRVESPFLGLDPEPVQHVGFTIGDGTQRSFAALFLNGKGVRFQKEDADVTLPPVQKTLDLPGPAWVDLWLVVDPATAAATPWYQTDAGPPIQIAGPQALPKDWFGGQKALAAGLYATRGTKPPFAATWSELTVESAPPAVRVNAGPALPGWPSDEAFVSGPSVLYAATTPVGVTPAVPTTTPSDVFRTERSSAGAPISWSFPLPPGDYAVQLYFAEIVHDAPGQRAFDVVLEGELVLDDYDVAAEVGVDVGTVETFEVSVADGDLDLELVPVVGHAKLSGVEVLVSPGPLPGHVLLYGQGVGGANQGVLDAAPPPSIGEPFALLLGQMGPFPAAAVLLSFAHASLPLAGGTLLVALPWIGDPIVLPLAGGYGLHVVTLPPVPAYVGLKLYAQGAAPDGGQPGGWRFTNGVQLTVGG